MTIASTTAKVQYSGNDSATDFPLPFLFFKSSDLLVVLTDGTGDETVLTEGVDYSVTGEGSIGGGSVSFPLSGSPMARNESLTIKRTIPYKQETDLRNQGGYYPEVVEDQFDRLVMMAQDLDEKVSRALTVSVSETGDPSEVLAGVLDSLKDWPGYIYDLFITPPAGEKSNVILSNPADSDAVVYVSRVWVDAATAGDFRISRGIRSGYYDNWHSPDAADSNVYEWVADCWDYSQAGTYESVTGLTLYPLVTFAPGHTGYREIVFDRSVALRPDEEMVIECQTADVAFEAGFQYEEADFGPNVRQLVVDFNNRYYGELSGEPAANPSGGAPKAGDFYLDTSEAEPFWKVFSDNQWRKASALGPIGTAGTRDYGATAEEDIPRNADLWSGTYTFHERIAIEGWDVHMYLGKDRAAYQKYYGFPDSVYFQIDRVTSNDDCTFVFTDKGQARGEIGLLGGDDNLHFKTAVGDAPNDAIFTDRMLIKPEGLIDVVNGTNIRIDENVGEPKLIIGNSDGSTTGSGLEVCYDNDATAGVLRSIDRDFEYRQLDMESNGFRIWPVLPTDATTKRAEPSFEAWSDSFTLRGNVYIEDYTTAEGLGALSVGSWLDVGGDVTLANNNSINLGDGTTYLGGWDDGATLSVGWQLELFSNANGDGWGDLILDSGGANVTLSAGGGVSVSTDMDVSGQVTDEQGINNQSASYTLVRDDAGKHVRMSVASANTLTIPANSSVAFPIGTRIDVFQSGSGTTTIAEATGVWLNNLGTTAIAGQYGHVRLVKVDTDTWDAYGDFA